MKFGDDLEIASALVIYAHPDDAEFGCSGTVAAWTKAGVEVTYCMVTNGAAGSSDPNMTRERLAGIRRAEQLAAAKILGVKEVVFLDEEDGELQVTLETRRKVTRVVRRVRPDVVIAQDPSMRFGGDRYVNHPDHIAAGELAARAMNPDAPTGLVFPELRRDEGLEPHKPKALLLMTVFGGATKVDISAVMETKVAALQAHGSQLGPDAIEFVRKFNADEGKEIGASYAEGFRVIRLDF